MARQRGFTLLLLLLVILLGGLTIFLGARDSSAPGAVQEVINDTTAAQRAREALKAYYLSDDEIPGALPCPDAGDDGVADVYCQGGGQAVYIGQLPWRTLDVDRELGNLWYALDRDFRNNSSAVQPLNPGVPGSLTVDGQEGFAALVIAPGDALSGQDRSSGDVAAFVEGGNEDGDVEFTDCVEEPDCNDRVYGITVDALFDRVQRRVVHAVARRLREFHEASDPGNPDGRYLSRAAPFGESACDDDSLLGQVPTEEGDCTGPFEELAANPDHTNGCDSEAGAGEWAPWIVCNQWLEFVVYHVDSECTASTRNCDAALMMLDDDADLPAVVAAAGRPFSDQIRPGNDITDYLDAPENVDGDKDYTDKHMQANRNDALRGVTLP